MKNHLKLGDWNALCDVCGFKFKASMLQKRWDGVMVCQKDYESRHPQDFLRVRKEVISTPWSRPEPTATFIDDVLEEEDGDDLTAEDGALLLTED